MSRTIMRKNTHFLWTGIPENEIVKSSYGTISTLHDYLADYSSHVFLKPRDVSHTYMYVCYMYVCMYIRRCLMSTVLTLVIPIMQSSSSTIHTYMHVCTYIRRCLIMQSSLSTIHTYLISPVWVCCWVQEIRKHCNSWPHLPSEWVTILVL